MFRARPRLRQLVRMLWDSICWIIATLSVVGARYDFVLHDVQWSAVLQYAAAACLLQLVVGMALLLYQGRYKTASFEESVGLALTVIVVAAILAVVFLGFVGPLTFPRALAVLAPPVALVGMAMGRWAYRAAMTRTAARSDPDTPRLLIYGAGNAGHQLARLLTGEDAPYRPVGFIDDDRSKRHLRLCGVPVLAGHRDLQAAADRSGASILVLAISAAGPELVRRTADEAEAAGLRFLILPPVQEIVGGRVRLSDLREVDLEDLLGRRQVDIDLEEIADYLTQRTVLVTGAGGSIGSELARQLHRFGPRELVLLDRDESALHAVQLSIYGQGLLDTPDIVLADIRDADALRLVFETHRPDVVFHAAALKHLPMLEQYPDEGWKTNVLGTLNVLEAARAVGCTRFVNVSTDKAADPTCTLGRTKRIAEQLTAWYDAHSLGTYLSVRFGNVLGSRGSVLHAFMEQIRRGGPITVTHPEVTRYFMTIPEACQLVVQAGAIGGGAEVLVLDMGEPVKILDVAQRLVARSGEQIDIVFTGLRPGEKLHEALYSHGEHGVKRHHPLITHVPVPPLDPSTVAPAWSAVEPLRAGSEVT